MVEEDEAIGLDFRTIPGMDPAANWLLNDARDDFLTDEDAPEAVPFLLELVDAEAARAFSALPRLVEGDETEDLIVLGFGGDNGLVAEGQLLPVVATRAWFLRLLTDTRKEVSDFVRANKTIVLSSPMRLPAELSQGPQKVVPPGPNFMRKGWPAGTVVMAAIDDGFGFVNERFRGKNGWSRIEFFWDMHRIFPINGGPAGELTKAEIDYCIQEPMPGGVFDEDQVYRREGQLDFSSPRHKPLAWRVSHGTHVLDLAAGHAPEDDVKNRPIIAMQLPSPVVARTAGDRLDFYLWLGVLYAMDRAGSLPLVINISFGYEAGSHDGKGQLDRFLDEKIRTRPAPMRILFPAGNAQLSRCHAEIDLESGTPVTLEWIVQPDDRTQSFIEIWLPEVAAGGGLLRLTITPPFGPPRSIDAAPGPRVVLRRSDGKAVGLAELVTRLDGRRHIRISIRPTARPEPHAGAVAPAGAWELHFDRADPHGPPVRGVAHAWIQRDDSLYGHPQRGRQSYFDNKDYRRFGDSGVELDEDPVGPPPCPITRTSLLNALASGEEVIVAGGYRQSDCRIAFYSAGGPNVPPEGGSPPRRKPDGLMPSEGSVALSGMLAAGTRSGARVAQNGTSVAAPQLARVVADMIADGGPGDRRAVAAKFDKAKFCDVETPEDRGGYGRLPRPDAEPVDRYSDT